LKIDKKIKAFGDKMIKMMNMIKNAHTRSRRRDAINRVSTIHKQQTSNNKN